MAQQNIGGIISSIDTYGNFSVKITSGENIIINNQESNLISIPYYKCNTAADNPNKTVSDDDNSSFTLKNGSLVIIDFEYVNTANDITLNVCGTGIKRVYYQGNPVSSDNIKNGVYIFVYDGTVYKLIGNINSKEFQGSTENQVGKSGLVPAPQINDQNKFLKSDGTWAAIESNVGGCYWISID